MEPQAPPLGRAAGTAVRWNAGSALVTMVSQLAQVFFLARWLTPQEFGAAAVAVSAAGLLHGLCDLGLTYALVQRQSLSGRAWSAAFWAAAATGILLALLLAGAAPAVEAGMELPGLSSLLVLAALSLPWFGPAAVLQAHLQRGLAFRRLSAAEMLAGLVSLAVALGWAWRDPGPMALVAGQVALVAVRFTALAFLSALRPARARPDLRELRGLTGFGGYQMGERVMNYAVANLDRLLVARLLGPAAAGYYFMASQIALRPAGLIGPFVSRTLLPLLARLQAEPARLGSAYLRSLSLLGLIAAFVYALLIGLAEPLVRIALGAGWENVVPVLRILSVLGFLIVLGNPLGSLILATGRAGVGFWLNAAVLAGRLGAVWIGAMHGLKGVAAAMVILTILSLPFDLLLPRRWVGLAPGRTAQAGAWALLPAVVTACAISALTALVSWPPWLEVVVWGSAGSLLFLGTAWLLQPRRAREALQEASRLR